VPEDHETDSGREGLAVLGDADGQWASGGLGWIGDGWSAGSDGWGQGSRTRAAHGGILTKQPIWSCWC
jgi:hypothetical protein